METVNSVANAYVCGKELRQEYDSYLIIKQWLWKYTCPETSKPTTPKYSRIIQGTDAYITFSAMHKLRWYAMEQTCSNKYCSICQ